MAKRKKKSGGGAFGSGAKPGPGGPARTHDFGRSARGDDQAIKLIQKALMSQGLQTPEELERFLNERMVGKPLDELAAQFEGRVPKTELDRADYLMDGLAEDASPAEIRGTAEQALKLSPYCVAAWLALVRLEEDPAKALELCDQGIEKGRGRFDGLMESLEGGQGIWGWIEARDFMHLMHERAMRLEEIGDLEESIEAYQEMLSLNPDDDQGARFDVLRLLCVFRRLEDARVLLDRFPDDVTTDMAFGRALIRIVETVDRTGYEIPAKGSANRTNTPSALEKSLSPDFRGAIQTLKAAVKGNPFVPLFMREPHIMKIEVPEMAIFGGPSEAAVYVRKWGAIWYYSGLPMVMMLAHYPARPDRLLKSRRHAEELGEILDQIGEHTGISWWENLEKMGK